MEMVSNDEAATIFIAFSPKKTLPMTEILEAVQQPAKLVAAFSVARENGKEKQLVEMTSTVNVHNHRRWRVACIILRGFIAFSQAGNDAAGIGKQEELQASLLQPPEEIVLDVEPESLSDLARSKNAAELGRLGGVEGIAKVVGTHAEKGIQGDDEDIASRKQSYGSNTIHQQPPNILHVLLETIRDPIIIVLLLCAILALGFGIKRLGKGGLSDGVTICIALLIVIAITASSNLWPKAQLFKLSKARYEFFILVLRNGQRLRISVFEAVVGDVVFLEAGDQVPADGLYLDGDEDDPLRMDESNVTSQMVSVEVNGSHNPFLLSGSKVIRGSARMLVTAVGRNTEWGEMMSMKIRHSDQTTPLQKRLRELTKLIALIGVMVASIALAVLLIRYFNGNLHDQSGEPHFVPGKTGASEVFDDVIGILATPVAIASTSIPEGLLLAVLVAIAFSTINMKTHKAQVTNLSACEVIGTTTVICTDENDLTANHLAVTGFCFGNQHLRGPPSAIPTKIFHLLHQVVLLTHTEDSPDSQINNAIQEWGDRCLGLDIEEARENYTIHLPQTSNSQNTQSFTWIKDKTDKSLHVHQKGEAEVILPLCSHYYDENCNIKDMSNSFRGNLAQIIQEMKSNGHQCIALAHKSMSEESNEEGGNIDTKLGQECLIFIGLLGMRYPCLPEVRRAVEKFIKAGVDIKIVTRNDRLTARATAIECGILENRWDMNIGEVVDGQEFRTYAANERQKKSLQIRVMARATTLDKLRMVQSLKEEGEVVAVTGGTSGDAEVLKEADVGLSLGTKGTQKAKANSDVIIMEDNLDSLARVLTWGRAMYHKIQLYAQFQLTVSISSLTIDFVTAVSAREPPTFNIVTTISSGKVPFATFQVLWVKLIVGTLAAVAITVEEPAELGKLPKIKRNQPFITNTMWKNIVGQALYPTMILLIIQFLGQSTFKLDSRVKDTMIFNIFVLWQLCAILNIKGMERNIFEGMWRRKLLWSIIGIIFLLQVMIVEPLHQFADTKPLTWKQWMVCVAIPVLASPYWWAIQCLKC